MKDKVSRDFKNMLIRHKYFEKLKNPLRKAFCK